MDPPYELSVGEGGLGSVGSDEPPSGWSPEETAVRKALYAELEARRDALRATLEAAVARRFSPHSIFATMRGGNLAQLHTLLKRGVFSTGERDANGATPLHVAAQEGRCDICTLLLGFGASLDAVDSRGRSAAELALAGRHLSVYRLLLGAARNHAAAAAANAVAQAAAPALPTTPESIATTPEPVAAATPETPAATAAATPETPGGKAALGSPRLGVTFPMAVFPARCVTDARGLPSPQATLWQPADAAAAAMEAAGMPLSQLRLPATDMDRANSSGAGHWTQVSPNPTGTPLLTAGGHMRTGSTASADEGVSTLVEGDGSDSPMVEASRFSSINDKAVVVLMVGLPGRGKSFISRRVARYMNWKGVPTRVFNAGDYRRRVFGASQTAGADFFDPTNSDAKQKREEMARMACEDMMAFIEARPDRPSIGILDATNTTKERRAQMFATVRGRLKKARILFIESVCDRPDIIRENILRAKCGGEDFANVDATTVVAQFEDRIKMYERVYETLDMSENVSFIKICNVKQTVYLHNVAGPIATRLSYFLMSLHPVGYPLLLTLPGQTRWMAEKRYSGDDSLTESGRSFCADMQAFVENYAAQDVDFTILHGTNSGCMETIAELNFDRLRERCGGADRVRVVPMCDLNALHWGAFGGETVDSAKLKHPKMFNAIFGKNYGVDGSQLYTDEGPVFPEYTVCAPRGESVRQVMLRLEQPLLEIMRGAGPILIIAPQPALAGIAGYTTETPPERCTTNFALGAVRLHHVLELGPKGERILHFPAAQAQGTSQA